MSGTGNPAGTPTGTPAGTTSLRVIRGVAAPTLWPIPVRQQLAIGALGEAHAGFCEGFCTGALITDRVVLTAAHCMEDRRPDSFEFILGSMTSNPVRRCPVATVRVNPRWDGFTATHDNALVFLKEPVPATIATPIPFNRGPLPNIIGKQVQNVGYGVTDPGVMRNINPIRLWTVEPVREVTGNNVTVDGNQISSVCGGDSGSPSLYKFPDGVIRIIGTLHGGDVSCTGTDTFARTDADAAWILSGGVGARPVDYAKSTVSERSKVPSYVWIAGGSAVALLGLTTIVLVIRRRRKAT